MERLRIQFSTLVVLLLLTVSISAQYVTISPEFFQPGIVVKSTKLYSYSGLRLGHIDTNKAYADYLKLRIGLNYPIDSHTNVLLGVNYNNIFNQYDNDIYVNFSNIKSMSLELGLIGNISPKFEFIFLYDILNHEADIGINLIKLFKKNETIIN